MLQTLRSREAAMPFIMLTVLIDMLAIGVIIPVLPPLVAAFSTSQADQAYWYGVAACAFGAATFVGSPILGALSDHFGRRRVLLLCFLGLALSFFGTALATTLAGLITWRIVGGAMGRSPRPGSAAADTGPGPADYAVPGTPGSPARRPPGAPRPFSSSRPTRWRSGRRAGRRWWSPTSARSPRPPTCR